MPGDEGDRLRGIERFGRKSREGDVSAGLAKRYRFGETGAVLSYEEFLERPVIPLDPQQALRAKRPSRRTQRSTPRNPLVADRLPYWKPPARGGKPRVAGEPRAGVNQRVVTSSAARDAALGYSSRHRIGVEEETWQLSANRCLIAGCLLCHSSLGRLPIGG